MKIPLGILLLIHSLSVVFAGVGDAVNGYPTNYERFMLVLTNAVRMAPLEYRDKYLPNTGLSFDYILLEENFPAVAPVYYYEPANEVARAHALDMANNCGMQHSSCDGTSFSARVRTAMPSGAISENIAYGQKTPKDVLAAWIIDYAYNGNVKFVPDDTASEAGHRKNIMSATKTVMGNGHALGYQKSGGAVSNTLQNHWVQDFGQVTQAYYAIASGGAGERISKSVKSYMASFYDTSNNAPQYAKVFIDNTSYDMQLDIGAASKGTYYHDSNDYGICHSYYFEFKSSDNKVWRYPETTNLYTKEVAECDLVSNRFIGEIKTDRSLDVISSVELIDAKGVVYYSRDYDSTLSFDELIASSNLFEIINAKPFVSFWLRFNNSNSKVKTLKIQ